MVTILNGMIGLAEMVMFEQRVKEDEEVNHLDIWGTGFQVEGRRSKKFLRLNGALKFQRTARRLACLE